MPILIFIPKNGCKRVIETSLVANFCQFQKGSCSRQFTLTRFGVTLRLVNIPCSNPIPSSPSVVDIAGLRPAIGPGNENSPVIHLELAESSGDVEEDQIKLQAVVESCLLKDDVLICVNKVSALDKIRVPASLRSESSFSLPCSHAFYLYQTLTLQANFSGNETCSGR